jgi:hypothetical protein
MELARQCLTLVTSPAKEIQECADLTRSLKGQFYVMIQGFSYHERT